MTQDEAMKLWRVASGKFKNSFQQPNDYRLFAIRLDILSKKLPRCRLTEQWTEQAKNYREIAVAIENMERR